MYLSFNTHARDTARTTGSIHWRVAGVLLKKLYHSRE